jgi:hypothetical protein
MKTQLRQSDGDDANNQQFTTVQPIPDSSPAERNVLQERSPLACDPPLTGANSQFSKTIGQSPRMITQRNINAQIQQSPLVITQRKLMPSMLRARSLVKRSENEALQQAEFGSIQRVAGETILSDALTDGPSIPQHEISTPKPNNTGLPDNLKSGIESLSGISMDGVKVHYNSSQPAQLNALAYAQGTDIHVAPGQEQHLPHEAWHVVQQAQGRVQPTIQVKQDVPTNVGTSFSDIAAYGNPRNIVQRRGVNIPTKEQMSGRASGAWFPAILSDTQTYETILGAVKLYYEAPATDYSVQLFRLREMQRYLGVWENKYGFVTQAIPPGKKSTADARREVLNDLVNGIALEVPHVQAQGFAKAKLEYAMNTSVLVNHLRNAAASTDRRLRNSAEWLLSGNGTKIYAVSPTGDSTARLDANNMDINADKAYFPRGLANSPGDIMSGSAFYNPNDYMDQTNVLLRPGGAHVNGWNQPGAVAVKDGATKSEAEIFKLIRHEVQHDLDMHKGRDALAAAHPHSQAFDLNGGTLNIQNGKVQGVNGGALAEADYQKFKDVESLQRYKSEYRAYSYEETRPDSEYNRLDNHTKNVVHMGEQFTARQLAIFKHIHDNYSYTSEAWLRNPVMADGRAFRRAVSDYYLPDTDGFNKFNSMKVHEFYQALDNIGAKDPGTYLEVLHRVDTAPVSAGGRVTDANDHSVLALLQVIATMSREDADWVSEQSQAMIAKINRHLGGAAKDKVMEDLEWL